MLSAYTAVYRLFLALSPIIGWFHPKLRAWASTRSQWKEDAADFRKEGKVIWFHCASVGEFEQARPVVEELRKEFRNQVQIVITFFSPSGFNAKRHYPVADVITYLPKDTPEAMHSFLDCFQPDLSVFVKYDFWWNAMQAMHTRSIPMILISAFLPDKHWTTQWPGIHLGLRLAQFERIFTQDRSTVDRLRAVNLDNAISVGDTRVDRVIQNAQTDFEMTEMEAFTAGYSTVVVGSAWPSDDGIIMDALKESLNVKAIVVPHEMHEGHMMSWKQSFGSEFITWSELHEEPTDLSAIRVIWVDRMGLLSKLYRFGNVAYVGGGFGKDVHNTLEAAVYGIPVLFGPKNKRFQEVQALKEEGIGLEVKSRESFAEALNKALFDSTYRDQVKTSSRTYFQNQKGATIHIVHWVAGRLWPASG